MKNEVFRCLEEKKGSETLFINLVLFLKLFTVL